MRPSSLRSILVTGAAGRIGTAFYEECRGRYRFRLADRDPVILDRPLEEGDSAVLLDIVDADACREAVKGIDTVVHLAADPSPEADFRESLLANNVAGTYNIFYAAADERCRRVVFASSVHAVFGYPLDEPVPEDAPVWPVNMYGASKAFGEATARAFASSGTLSAVAIRIGAYEAPWIVTDPSTLNLSAYISPRDLNQLLMRCIDVEDVDFALVHGVSDNSSKRLSIDATRAILDYQPQDDGFAKNAIGPENLPDHAPGSGSETSAPN
jgi:nucleoside-diphosphate-sugar epimerase